MPIIKRLPDHLANQIAAGEVVQRPSSVVKELLENAIDAEATKISLLIKDGGRTSIQVIDDGKGMHVEDAKLCFERHATSKINCIEDLYSIQTKGFRGEALASIGAVAHVNLKTKQNDQDTGFLVQFEGGKNCKTEEIICPKGTSIEVKNLFYNIPARRNFLKSDAIEFNHIEDEFLHVALAHPEIHFEFINNNQELYNLPIDVLKKRITDVIGKNGSEKIFPIETQSDIIQIHGFIGKPETAKKTRGNQFFFVNKRFFRNSYFHHAISKAFEGLIQEKTYPSYYIFFTVDPSKIDVNIHPTKTEIKFEEDRFIYSILTSTVRQSLGQYNIAPSLDFNLDTAFDIPASFRSRPLVEPTILVDPNYNPFSEKKSNGNSKAIQQEGFGRMANPNPKEWESFYKINETQIQENESLFESSDVKTEQISVTGKFIIVPTRNGLLVIDGKRAMERIRYEEIIQSFVHKPLHHQMLLFPLEKPIDKVEFRMLDEHQKLLEQIGFKFSLSPELLSINGAPDILEENNIMACFEALLVKLAFQDVKEEDIAHQLISEMCKQSVSHLKFQAGPDTQYLIERLFTISEHTHTPNNQPIMGMISLEQLAGLIQ